MVGVEEGDPIEGGENGSGEFGSIRLRGIGRSGHVWMYQNSHVWLTALVVSISPALTWLRGRHLNPM